MHTALPLKGVGYPDLKVSQAFMPFQKYQLSFFTKVSCHFDLPVYNKKISLFCLKDWQLCIYIQIDRKHTQY